MFLLIKIDVDYNYIREYKDLSDFEIQLSNGNSNLTQSMFTDQHTTIYVDIFNTCLDNICVVQNLCLSTMLPTQLHVHFLSGQKSKKRNVPARAEGQGAGDRARWVL